MSGAGDFVMLYPKWLPGNHSPTGQINKVAGFRASANGHELKWVRDDLDVYAFHIAVPQGVSAIDVDFQYVSPTAEQPGPRRRHSRHGEHPVDRQFDVPRGLFRARYSGAGVGDRPGRVEGRDRASAERADRATASTIR